MKLLYKLIKEVYTYSKTTFILTIILTVLAGLTDGIGLLMLVPLLSFTEISKTSSNVLFVTVTESINKLSEANQLLLILIGYVSLIIFRTLLNRKVSILNTEIVQGYTRYLRLSLYENTFMSNWQCLMNKKKSDMMNAFTTETARISFGVVSYLKMISQVFVAICQLIVAFYLSIPLTLLITISGIVIFMGMKSTLKESKKLGKALQVINQELQGEINDQLNGIKEIKSYGIEKFQIEQFRKTTAKIEDNIVSCAKLQSKPELYYKIGAALLVSLIVYIAVIYLKVETSSMIIIIVIFSRFWPLFSSLQSNLQNIFVMLPVYDNMLVLQKELRDSAETLISHQLPIVLERKISFKNIDFRYNNTTSFELRNVNLEIPAKKITAVVGSSGAGKSTIIDLLMGLLRPFSGAIWVDERVVDTKIMQEWRQCIGYVSQDAFLLNASIKENLRRFNPEAEEEAITEALRLSAAKEFIDKLPQGIQTVIGDRGVKLSGGERQRIILARALLRKPKLLVLDEATSALDNENEYKIQKAVENLRGKMTVVVIAHRLTTIQGADQVIVVEQGKLVEVGSYGELASKENGYFRKMLAVTL